MKVENNIYISAGDNILLWFPLRKLFCLTNAIYHKYANLQVQCVQSTRMQSSLQHKKTYWSAKSAEINRESVLAGKNRVQQWENKHLAHKNQSGEKPLAVVSHNSVPKRNFLLLGSLSNKRATILNIFTAATQSTTPWAYGYTTHRRMFSLFCG
jgi:hypothetical protein